MSTRPSRHRAHRGRYGGVEGVPDVLGRNEILLPAVALFAVEFVADKIPTSTTSGTPCTRRSGRRSPRSWGAPRRRGQRPRRGSCRVLSLAEDSVVVAVLLLAVDHPWWALAAALVLLVGAASLGLFLIRRIRQFVQRLRGPPAPATRSDLHPGGRWFEPGAVRWLGLVP